MFMVINITSSSACYLIQKILLQMSLESGNPIHPFEWTYFVCIIMFIIQFARMYYFNEEFFPIHKNVRITYIVRCVIGMMCNLSFLMSLKFIPFSKASVFFWMSPVFTALVAHYYLHEKLTIYDWGAVFIAFIGIIIIQNPFGERSTHTMEVGFWEDLIGSGLALLGALMGSAVSISIRIITTRTKLHYMVIPMGFVIGNLLLCPVFLFTKVFITPVEQGNLIVTESPQG